MAKSDNGFEQMMDIWQEGQDAFLKAQKEVAESFQKTMSPMFEQNVGAENAPFKAWQEFIKTWAPDWDPSAMMEGPSAAMFTQGREAFMTMLDPSNWTKYAPEQLREILQSVAQGPQFADLATPHIDAANTWREALDYQTAAADLSKVLQESWTRTYLRFNQTHSLEDLQSGDIQEALDVWLKSANHELLETQRSAEFMDAQKRMLRASVEIKARQRDMAEAWSEAYQIPTRTEVDDLTKIVHELRRELRQVKRELSSAKAKSKK